MQDIPADVRSGIAKDVPRSFPEYVFFEDAANRANLERVLLAYAASDPEVGYCQGLNFLAGCILLYAPKPDEAFATLHLLLKHQDMRVLFLPNFEYTQVRTCATHLLLAVRTFLCQQTFRLASRYTAVRSHDSVIDTRNCALHRRNGQGPAACMYNT
jgi:Rab-GTPase-TBC domain